MTAALARHDAILRGAIASHHGRVVKTTGDGFHGVFARPDEALGAAVEAQRAIAGEAGEGGVQLLVRMGVHTGAGEERDGDYYGTAVNRAARLMAVAHGGQVLASRAVQELVGDELGDSVELVGLGEHRLRDLAQPVEVFQVVAPGLAREFPALQSLDALPGNLPVQHSSFVGREREVAELAALVREARIVTLTGVGGVGKTRLACQVAAEVVAASFVTVRGWWSWPGCATRASWWTRSRRCSGWRHGRVSDLVDTLAGLLATEGAAAGARQLRAPARRRWSSWSARSRRRARGWWCSRRAARAWASPVNASWPCRRSALPGSGDRDAVLSSDAARFFVERAVAVKSDFAVTDANARRGRRGGSAPRRDPAGVGAGRGADPGVEPGAARATARPAVPSARRGRAGRDRTPCDAACRDRLVVRPARARRAAGAGPLVGVRGGCSLEAAEAVCSGGGIDELEVLDLLSALVARSLVVAEDAASGERRYRLLETIRQYAEERVDDAERPSCATATPASTSTSWRRAADGLRGPDQLRWLLEVEAELENVRAAMAWSVSRDDGFARGAVPVRRSASSPARCPASCCATPKRCSSCRASRRSSATRSCSPPPRRLPCSTAGSTEPSSSASKHSMRRASRATSSLGLVLMIRGNVAYGIGDVSRRGRV